MFADINARPVRALVAAGLILATACASVPDASAADPPAVEVALARPDAFADWYSVPANRAWHDWVTADEANRAFFEWVLFMQDPANAAWFEWKLEQDRVAREQAAAPTSVEGMIRQVFGAAAPRALRIARCESNLVPTARNPSGASGVFQIMLPLHSGRFYARGWSPADWRDPWKNIVVAHDLYLDSGFGPWVCK